MAEHCQSHLTSGACIENLNPAMNGSSTEASSQGGPVLTESRPGKRGLPKDTREPAAALLRVFRVKESKEGILFGCP